MSELRATDAAAAAWEFAIKAHAGQHYGIWPYSVHLERVASGVRALGFPDPDLEVIAYLHDVVEDTAVKPQEIEERFGPDIRAAVEQLTYRGQPVMAYVIGMRDAAFAVKLADRISNIAELGRSSLPHSDQVRLLAKYEKAMPAFAHRCQETPAFRDALRVLRAAIESARLRVENPPPPPRIELPIYSIMGLRPVMAVRTPDGGMDIMALDWNTGGFVRDMSYFNRLVFPTQVDDSQFVSRRKFERYTRKLRRQHGLGSGA